MISDYRDSGNVEDILRCHHRRNMLVLWLVGPLYVFDVVELWDATSPPWPP